jgi:Flp pilus assembly protein CpaB
VLISLKSTNGAAELRTILEGVPVVAVKTQLEASSQGANLPTVTLLTNPADADVLALADSGARVRLALRNPLDGGTRPRTLLTLDTLLRASGTSPASVSKAH